jgi:putative restriction endonuclease
MPPSSKELLEQLSTGLNVWKRGDQRAPHKPLLLLVALARIQQGKDRLGKFEDINYDLAGHLERFGPARKSYHPEFPFWHLRSDGLWEIPGHEKLKTRWGSSSPTAKTLKESSAEGGLPLEHYELLKSDPELLANAAKTILEAHFPASIHEDILDAIGLDLAVASPEAGEGGKADKRQKRDPRFRTNVLQAYNWACAICGFKGWLEGTAFGVEAAHVRWHSHDGPSTVDNGLCLCSLHHKALDRGVIGIDDDYKLLVTQRLEENPHTQNRFFWFQGKEVEAPRDSQLYPRVAGSYRRWHRENCFRS